MAHTNTFLLLLLLFLCLFPQDGRKREIYKLFIVSKDSLKAQVNQLFTILEWTFFSANSEMCSYLSFSVPCRT